MNNNIIYHADNMQKKQNAPFDILFFLLSRKNNEAFKLTSIAPLQKLELCADSY